MILTLSLRETAKALGVTPASARKLLDAPKSPLKRLPEFQHLRVSVYSVLQYLGMPTDPKYLQSFTSTYANQEH